MSHEIVDGIQDGGGEGENRVIYSNKSVTQPLLKQIIVPFLFPNYQEKTLLDKKSLSARFRFTDKMLKETKDHLSIKLGPEYAKLLTKGKLETLLKTYLESNSRSKEEGVAAREVVRQNGIDQKIKDQQKADEVARVAAAQVVQDEKNNVIKPEALAINEQLQFWISGNGPYLMHERDAALQLLSASDNKLTQMGLPESRSSCLNERVIISNSMNSLAKLCPWSEQAIALTARNIVSGLFPVNRIPGQNIADNMTSKKTPGNYTGATDRRKSVLKKTDPEMKLN